MRTLFSLAALVLVSAAPAVAAAACGDPGSSPSIEGKGVGVVQAWDGDPNQRQALVFNPDCSLDSAYDYESLGTARWSQQGSTVSMDFNGGFAIYTGQFDGRSYQGTMSNGTDEGSFSGSVRPKPDLRLWLWAGLDQSCSASQKPGSVAGASVSGIVLWPDGQSRQVTYRLKPDCTGVEVGNTKTELFWGQEGDAVLMSLDDEALVYVGRFRDGVYSGEVKRKGGEPGRFSLRRLDW